ncbi:phosphatase PAP2 family protein [Kineococcus rhizosphaerae]|uniref:phosphatase PAP2 family protein n=1 Tax=Kineococcus rhizosphaerae TaxID=559628 RepID=UPI000D07A1A4|nr:phosphatase PAP2 family protein [Kineococcus rhizosphaerae]
MDRIRPADGRDLLVRAVAPGVVLWGLIAGFGLALTGPLAGLSHAEEAVNDELAADRTPGWNTVTLVWSHLGNTETVIGVCLVVAGLLLWRTRDWRLAAVPAIAIALQAVIFATVSSLVGRDRPSVAKLDVSPPTTSYPSGHTGASTALYVAFALVALQVHRTWLRRLTVIACLLVPLLVAFARLYRGMHHVSDVGAAMVIGLGCALLAHGWYRHRTRSTTSGTRAAGRVRGQYS